MSKNLFFSLSNGISLNLEIHDGQHPTWLVCLHGLGEHLGRNSYLPELFASKFNILQFDLRGHGLSDGKRAYIDDFRDYSKDLQEILQMLKNDFQMDRYILFGHSMSGLIVADFLQNFVDKDNLPERVYLSSPSIGVPTFPGSLFYKIPKPILKFIAQHLPGVPLKNLVDLNELSYDPQVAKDYVMDDLCCLKINSSLPLKLIERSRQVFAKPLGVDIPIFASVGTIDKIVCPKMFKEYFTNIEPKAKTLLLENGHHEPSNEIESIRSKYIEFLTRALLAS